MFIIKLLLSNTDINLVIITLIESDYYLHKYLHFYVQTRIVDGQHMFDVRKDLSEFRFSGGLGLNINSIKK
ncbi:MAG: hypothetical protein IPP60_02155 [Sphingobacteriales bacterium]|nr:hypothetical protein [Sphingobacteriales bacterium]MBP8192748.1 hypothetical protein [Chitinophagales bacterium]